MGRLFYARMVEWPNVIRALPRASNSYYGPIDSGDIYLRFALIFA